MFRKLLLLVIIVPSSAYAQQFYGHPMGIDGFNNSRIGKVITSSSPWTESSLKSVQELDDYFRCHIAGGQEGPAKVRAQNRLAEFNVKYRPIIELAVQHYGVPYSLLTCTLFRETLFKNINNSSSGARGMAQIMPKTYKEILKDMWDMVPEDSDVKVSGKARPKKSKPWASYHKEYLQRVKDFDPENPKNRCKEFPKYDCDGGFDYIRKYTGKNPYLKAASFRLGLDSTLYQQASKEERIKSDKASRGNLTQFRINNHVFNEHKTFLMSYYRGLTSRSPGTPLDDKTGWPVDANLHQGFIKYDPVKAAIIFPDVGAGFPKDAQLMPPDSIDDMTQNPLWVVATSAYLYKQMMLQADSNFGDCDLKGDDAISFFMFLGGGYNGGISRMTRTVGKGCRSVRQWCEDAKGYTSETKDYMLTLRRCMTRGSNTGITGQKPGACQGDGLPETHDPCDPVTPIETQRAEPGDGLRNILEDSVN